MRRYCASRAPCRPPGRRSASAMADEYPKSSVLRQRARARRSDRGPTKSSHPLALLREIVDQQVLAEAVGARVERAALVDARHPLDECPQARAVVEHERVDDDAAPR